MRAPRTTLALLLVALGAVLLAGCGGSSAKDERQPVACHEGVATYLNALRAAPGEVILTGETPISGCLVPAAEEGEVADLGEGALAAATKLNAQARAQRRRVGGEASSSGGDPSLERDPADQEHDAEKREEREESGLGRHVSYCR